MDHGGKMIVAIEVDHRYAIQETAHVRLGGFRQEIWRDRHRSDPLPLAAGARSRHFRSQRRRPERRPRFAPPKAATVLAKQFKGVPFRLWWTRVVKAGGSTKYQVEPLLTVNPPRPMVWADDNLAGLFNFKAYTDDLVRTGRIDTLYFPTNRFRSPSPSPKAAAKRPSRAWSSSATPSFWRTKISSLSVELRYCRQLHRMDDFRARLRRPKAQGIVAL